MPRLEVKAVRARLRGGRRRRALDIVPGAGRRVGRTGVLMPGVEDVQVTVQETSIPTAAAASTDQAVLPPGWEPGVGDIRQDGGDPLLSIGVFARRSRLSMKALRHYDRLGLLTPAEVDQSSGYRRYRESQLATARLV